MESKTNVDTKKIERALIDEEELAKRIAKALSIGNDNSKNFEKYKDVEAKHNIIVID